MPFGMTYSPTVPVGGAKSYYVMVIGKCTDVLWGVFIWLGAGVEKRGNFSWRKKFVMGEENFHEGSAGFSSII